MNEILEKVRLSSEVFKFVLKCPQIASSHKAGQFVVIKEKSDYAERIPLTIANSNKKDGTITIVFQTVGESTLRLSQLKKGDQIDTVLGPLGKPTNVKKVGKVVCVGGGLGAAPLYPIARAFKEAGNDVRVINCARSSSLLVMKDELRGVDKNMIIATDDGSEGQKAISTVPLEELIKTWKPNLCVFIGPPIMMKFCVLKASEYKIPSIVSLNTIMVDGTGMCGGCRVTVGGETKFVCADGPEFEGDKVDWENMFLRMKTYSDEEKEASHKCRIDLQLESK